MKLALVAKIGVIKKAGGDLVPSSGTEEAAAAAVVDGYINGDDDALKAALLATPEQLQQTIDGLCS